MIRVVPGYGPFGVPIFSRNGGITRVDSNLNNGGDWSLVDQNRQSTYSNLYTCNTSLYREYYVLSADSLTSRVEPACSNEKYIVR
eukprot:scaffold128020_cov47-Attheya_sp.AAC.5